MIKIYDQSMKLKAFAENAFNVSYEKKLNQLWTAQFSLPGDDAKNVYCQPFWFAEVLDGDQRIDLFRFSPVEAAKSDDYTITYKLEHVLATLLDDILYQYHEVGGLGVRTDTVIQYVLSRQTVARWKIGVGDFTRQFQYSWENENLLAALFSIPAPFVDSYMWDWDTTAYPWTLRLKARDTTTPTCYIRYGKNLLGITKTSDPSALCTRLYPLGYGEGRNQLTIADANGGKDYLDADTQGDYGIVTKIWTDRRYTYAETLKEAARAILEELKQPSVTYAVEAADLSQLTTDDMDVFECGGVVRVIDPAMGENFTAPIVTLRKTLDRPGEISMEISNTVQTAADTVADIADRARINETYSQGSTALNVYQAAENADATHPVTLSFYIPENAVHVNLMDLNYKCSAFRAYSKSIASSPASSQTSSSGGSSTPTSGSGGGANTTTQSGGGDVESSTYDDSRETWQSGSTIQGGWVMEGAGDDDHVHNVFRHRHNHAHNVTIPSHNHGLNLPSHTHSVTVPAHQHTVTVPAHTHGIEYGIYTGATPTAVAVTVDDTVVPGQVAVSGSDIDIIDYLDVDSSGKITRGWHTIKIQPNTLGRVEINLAAQVFVAARGGGQH